MVSTRLTFGREIVEELEIKKKNSHELGNVDRVNSICYLFLPFNSKDPAND
ncbi:12272_t:CDS:2, partial [Funneliformis geosporum]